MSNVIFNNFTAGLVTAKLAGNYNSSAYHNGCSVLENFSVMLQGGITRRPPLLSAIPAADSVNLVRIWPFVIDSDRSYLVGFGVNVFGAFFRMWLYDNTDGSLDAVKLSANDYVATIVVGENENAWTADEMEEMQFAQSADTLYIAHEKHPPKKIQMSGSYWTLSNIQAKLTQYNGTYFDPMNENESGQGNIFCTAGNYPAVVAFTMNRLWLASSINHHIRYWCSRPFDHESFAYYEMVMVENTVIDQDKIFEAITAMTYDNTATYAVGDVIRYSGYLFKCNTAIVTPEDFNPAHWDYEGIVDAPTETVYTYEDTVTEDCAFRFDASGNDAIRWISAKNNIIVGTASGEYYIPGQVNGINYRLNDLSSYGSQKGVQAVQANGEVLFPQSGGRKIRSITVGEDGFSCLDLTYQCDLILSQHGGVKRLAWRRVPDPTLYVVCNDGTVAVLFYDRMYGLCAWAHWSFKKAATGTDLAEVKDVAVIDTEIGQRVVFLVKRASGVITAETLMELDASESMNVSYKDLGTIPYVSEMVSNPYEYNSSAYGSSLGKKKRMRAIRCRVYKTKAFEAGYDERYMKNFSGSEGLNDVEVLLPGGYENFVQMTVRSVEDKPLTLLAFSLDMEAER